MAHETGEPKNFLILGVGVGSIVTLFAVMLSLNAYFDKMRDQEQQVKIGDRPNAELVELWKADDHKLSSYSYIDKTAGRVRIPVKDAMRMLAQRGRDAVPALSVDPSTVMVAPASGSPASPTGSPAAVPSGGTPSGAASTTAPANSSGAPAASGFVRPPGRALPGAATASVLPPPGGH